MSKKRHRRKKSEKLVLSATPIETVQDPAPSSDDIGDRFMGIAFKVGQSLLDIVETQIKISPVFKAMSDLGIVDETDLTQMRSAVDDQVKSILNPRPEDIEDSKISERQRGRSEVIHAITYPPRS